MGEMALKKAYMHLLNNIYTMAFPHKYIKENEHITRKSTKRDLLTFGSVRSYDNM